MKVYQSLTPRQLEVLDLMCNGLTNAQIGERLGISARTVESHTRHLLQRTGTRRRVELVAQVVRTSCSG
jgi:DNA-binding CsgD family transcriptional regulator